MSPLSLPTPRTARPRPWVAALLAVLVAPIAGAQTERFGDETSVVVVEVPVQVVSHGEAVRGLTAADFELRDEGRLRELVGFDVIDLQLAEDENRPIPVTARRHVLLLFDLSFSDPSSIERARRAGLDVLDRALHPADLAAVATYSSSRGAQLVLGFTPDREQLRGALDSLSLAEPIRHYRDPLALVVGDAFDPGHPLRGGGGAGNNKRDRYEIMLQNYRDIDAFAARSARDLKERDILSLAGSFEDLGRLMRGVAGRKQVVLLSEGFDSSILVGTNDARRMLEIAEDSTAGEVWRVDSEERYGSSQTKQAVDRAIEEFRRADCVIQAVDIGGVRGGADVRLGGQDGLFILADQTGGELYRNYNEVGAAMGDLIARTSVTYVLSFQPDDVPLDGSFRHLKVKLLGGPKGARVVNRPGYYTPRPYAELSTTERRLQTAGLIVGGREGGTLPMAVLAAPFAGGGEAAYVPVLLELDGRTLLRGGGANVALEIYGYALTRSGEVRDFFAQSLNLEVAKVGPALERSGFKFWGHFQLPPDEYVLRVLARNALTGDLALRLLPLRVPAAGDGEAYLSPPLVPEPEGKWLLSVQTGERPDVAYPFVLAGDSFVPAARPVLARGRRVPLTLVAYNLGALPAAARAELFTAGGQPAAAVPIAILASEGGAGALRVEAQLDGTGLAPGEYDLVVTLTDASGARQGSSRISVVVAG